MASAAPRYLLVEAHGDWLQGETSPEAQHNRVIYIIGLMYGAQHKAEITPHASNNR